jgi:hypothetical protein
MPVERHCGACHAEASFRRRTCRRCALLLCWLCYGAPCAEGHDYKPRLMGLLTRPAGASTQEGNADA